MNPAAETIWPEKLPFQEMHLPGDLFEKFQEIVYRSSSLRFSSARLSNLESKIRERAFQKGAASLEDYYDILLRNDAELDTLIEYVTTKETYFFRIPGQFRFLGESIIPAIEEKLCRESGIRGNKEQGFDRDSLSMRIWSAGCSTGEEPYSIAMTVRDSLKYPRAWDVQILATDISGGAVSAAAAACYDAQALDRMPRAFLNRYVCLNERGGIISDDIRKMISFGRFNLSKIPPSPRESSEISKIDGKNENVCLANRFDVIFCRNVLIYFDFNAQQRLVDKLFACLKPGGYLFTGDAELLHIYRHKFETVYASDTYCYRRPAGGS